MKNAIAITFSVFVMIFAINAYTYAAETVSADPDHISTGLEYRGTPDARIGDTFGYKRVMLGGMAEIRNESRFNQGALPNHNWRGFAFLYYNHPLEENGLLTLTSGVEHESAHPTMGLNDGNNSAYDKIYDSTYRNINLNSFLLRLNGFTGSGYTLNFICDIQFYYGRNTPELPVNRLAWSEGFSGGIEFRYPVYENLEFFISGFDRYIFQSRKKSSSNIYHDTVYGAETRYEEYPVINDTNTVSLKTGFTLNSLIPGRKASVYFEILYGNIYGFVDSREKRTVYSAGIEVSH